MTPLTAREALADVRLLTIACRLARGESLASVAAGIGITANNLQKYCQSRGWEVRYRAPRWGMFNGDKEICRNPYLPDALLFAWLDYEKGRARTACKLARVARQHGCEWRRVPADRFLGRINGDGWTRLVECLPPGWQVWTHSTADIRSIRLCCDPFTPGGEPLLEHKGSLWCAACTAGWLKYEENWR